MIGWVRNMIGWLKRSSRPRQNTADRSALMGMYLAQTNRCASTGAHEARRGQRVNGKFAQVRQR